VSRPPTMNPVPCFETRPYPILDYYATASDR
jgi:hypothetical protein